MNKGKSNSKVDTPHLNANTNQSNYGHMHLQESQYYSPPFHLLFQPTSSQKKLSLQIRTRPKSEHKTFSQGEGVVT